MGGKTSEHEISLLSGIEVVRNLSGQKYDVFPVVISPDGKRWQLIKRGLLLAAPNPFERADTVKVFKKRGLWKISALGRKIDVAFLAMHGPYGEDGRVQGMLDLAGIRYTGSGVLASAIGMDKITFRKLMQSAGIPVPKHTVVKKGQKASGVQKILGPPPYFVKPYNQGSSVGASIVKKINQLKGALSRAFQHSNLALVDKYIKGTEVTCALLGNENPRPLPLVEIVPGTEFFDYESKYRHPKTREIVPARIPKALAKEVQKLAIRTHKEVGCRGFSRVDFILESNKTPVVLEINTIPGLTPASLFPKAAKKAGISYTKLLDKIISHALQ